jgi:hypothetical protein
VDRRGVEPRSPACDAGVVPLDQQPAITHDRKSGPAGESNPDLLGASQASSRWTSRPFVHVKAGGPPESRTRSPSLQKRDAPGTPTDHHSFRSMNRVVPEGIEPPFPLCKRGVVAVGPRDVDVTRRRSPSSSTGGIRTHRHQTLSLTAMPVRVPCRRLRLLRSRDAARDAPDLSPNCGPGSRTTASEFMRLGRAPARPQWNPRPRYRAGRPAV